MRGRYIQQLNRFMDSPSAFSVIHTTSQSEFVLPLTDRINILDSSFNPPHKGHFSLVKSSIIQKFDKANQKSQSATINNKTILLLLSVQNADKGVQLASFSDRLDMMHLLAETIHQELGVSVSIGLSKNAFFAEKALSIKKYLKDTYERSNISLSFLMGFDTLIRVFNPKYYTPQPLSEALETFMNTSDLLVLTRDDGSASVESQFQYVSDIKSNKSQLEIPSEWADKIYMVKGDTESLLISSSGIRKSLESSGGEWKKDTTPEISQYIVENMPYKA